MPVSTDAILESLSNLNRAVGKMEGSVDSNARETHEQIAKLFEKVDEIAVHGCNTGLQYHDIAKANAQILKAHHADIATLKAAGKKSHGIAASVGSGVTLGAGGIIMGVLKLLEILGAKSTP